MLNRYQGWHRQRLIARDGEIQFPYLHFVCWKHNQWSQLPEPDLLQIKRLAAGSAWNISATGFASGEL